VFPSSSWYTRLTRAIRSARAEHGGLAGGTELPEQVAADQRQSGEERDPVVEQAAGQAPGEPDGDEKEDLVDQGDEEVGLVAPEDAFLGGDDLVVEQAGDLHEPREDEGIQRGIDEVRMLRFRMSGSRSGRWRIRTPMLRGRM
jgi:hypothetical protein